jgi:hypothetical protein
MFEFCTILNKVCAFCTKSKWNPYIEDYDDTDRLFCGVSSGFDTRVEALDECWMNMSKGKRNNFTKAKREEYQILKTNRS